MNKVVVFIIVILLFPYCAWSLSVNGPVVKISGIDISPQEFSRLPEFLQAQIKYHHSNHSAPVYKKWEKKFGVDYQHFHHWAAAIVKLDRAMKIFDKTKRNFAYGVVVDEYNYLLKSCTKYFRFRYLFHHGKGKALYLKGDIPNAIGEFERSRHLNDKYLANYVMLSSCYLSLGMKSEAKKIDDLKLKLLKSKNKNFKK